MRATHTYREENKNMGGYAIPIVSGQHGGGALPVYSGNRRQVGGNIFSTVARFALPLLHRMLPFLKQLGKRAGKAALNVGTGMATDLFTGNAKQIPELFKNRSRNEVDDIAKDYLGRPIFQQSGSGKRKRRRGSIMKKKKRKAKHASKKRKIEFSDIFDKK